MKKDEMGEVCSSHREMINALRSLIKMPEEGDCLEDLGVDGRIVLKWILGKFVLGVLIGFTWFRQGTGGRLL
jgi:hypothetical protein